MDKEAWKKVKNDRLARELMFIGSWRLIIFLLSLALFIMASVIAQQHSAWGNAFWFLTGVSATFWIFGSEIKNRVVTIVERSDVHENR